MLNSTMGELGILVGRQWRAPIVAVMDGDGDVVWQAQGVTDWEGIGATCRAQTRDR